MDDKVLQYDPYTKKNICEIDELYNIKNHPRYIRNIYNGTKFDGYDYIERSIKRKLSSYKSQDKQNRIYDEERFISLNDL